MNTAWAIIGIAALVVIVVVYAFMTGIRACMEDGPLDYTNEQGHKRRYTDKEYADIMAATRDKTIRDKADANRNAHT